MCIRDRANDSWSSVAISCQKLLKFVDECGRYSKPNQCYFGMQHDWWDQISRVHVSRGSAGTLARRGGITNHQLIAYSLSNISAKKLRKSVNVRWSYSVLHQCLFLRQCIAQRCSFGYADFCPVFLPNCWKNSTNSLRSLQGYWTEVQLLFTRCSNIIAAVNACIHMVILPFVVKRQSTK